MEPISIKDLERYFSSLRKAEDEHVIGAECELFAVHRTTGRPLSYFGKVGIETLLNRLVSEHGYEGIDEAGHMVALKKDGNSVTIEPGAQLELSAATVKTVHDVKGQLDTFLKDVHAAAAEWDVAWLSMGFHPYATLDEIEWVPKQRYEIMRSHMIERGSLAHDMMKRTATNQINLDFSDEADAMRKLRTAYAATSIVSALYSNSAIAEGIPNGYLTKRMSSWSDTDPDRTGLLLQFLKDDASFDDYLRYVLAVPLMFIVRGREYVRVRGLSFEQYLIKGYQGHQATLADFEMHLSALFPEVRVKNWIEIRGADAQPKDLIPSVMAIWKGLLYSQGACQATWNLLRNVSEKERRQFHHDIEKQGLNAQLGGAVGWELVREIYEIAWQGLKEQRQFSADGQDETVYLLPLKERIISKRLTLAEQVLLEWDEKYRDHPATLIRDFEC